ncbi:hypothetical protein KFL_001450230 [Klebsormidium nitens]|uniref:Uncharacterized protein n=1 Tax=Klebsormidium nitens TaxID=105231 RepID=A0A1Y1HXH8_KLENI|nr:hypothetical protein KFL_001450230 [Klebsormidium nitens]|eukprot:GAQ83370.1 hypothetical protein KFL_001450230 [Klebsormidium nitens]
MQKELHHLGMSVTEAWERAKAFEGGGCLSKVSFAEVGHRVVGLRRAEVSRALLTGRCPETLSRCFGGNVIRGPFHECVLMLDHVITADLPATADQYSENDKALTTKSRPRLRMAASRRPCQYVNDKKQGPAPIEELEGGKKDLDSDLTDT